MKKHCFGIFLVFCILLTVLILEICALVQSKWWTCDVTVQVPILNVTLHSKDTVTIALKMQTSLSDSCWHLETVSGPVQQTLFMSPRITKCLLKDFNELSILRKFNSTNNTNSTNSTSENLEQAIEESRAGFWRIQISIIACLVCLGIGLVIGLINIFVCNGCLVLSNLFIIFSTSICSIASVIYSSTTINYDAKFNVYNRELIPSMIVWSDLLTTEGKFLMEILFKKLDKLQALRHKCSRGLTFTINWMCLVLISVAFFASILTHIVGVRSSDTKYKKRIYSGDGGGSGGGIKLQSFDDLDDDD